ncbi:MAG: hypothetical protein WC389_18635, partial [Lutibacter sp.]
MKNLKFILILSLLLVSASPVFAANDVTVTEDTNIELTNPAMTLILETGSTYSSMTVTASTVSFVISAGGTVTVTSVNKYSLNPSLIGTDIICASSG